MPGFRRDDARACHEGVCARLSVRVGLFSLREVAAEGRFDFDVPRRNGGEGRVDGNDFDLSVWMLDRAGEGLGDRPRHQLLPLGRGVGMKSGEDAPDELDPVVIRDLI